MKKSRLVKSMLLFLITLLAPTYVFAGSFKVRPIKLFFKPGNKTVALTIMNNSQEEATIQMSSMKWNQDQDGQAVYSKAKELIYFPKMVTIEPGGERVIRVGFKGERSLGEQAYRLFVRELPVTKPGEMALKMALKIGVPVFIEPAKKEERISVEKVEMSAENKTLDVIVKNGGNSHFVVSRIMVVGEDDAGNETFSHIKSGWYVLPGISKKFSIILPDGCVKSSKVKVSVEVNKKTTDVETDVIKDRCPPPKETE